MNEIADGLASYEIFGDFVNISGENNNYYYWSYMEPFHVLDERASYLRKYIIHLF